jgi:hypothetical protein
MTEAASGGRRRGGDHRAEADVLRWPFRTLLDKAGTVLAFGDHPRCPRAFKPSRPSSYAGGLDTSRGARSAVRRRRAMRPQSRAGFRGSYASPCPQRPKPTPSAAGTACLGFSREGLSPTSTDLLERMALGNRSLRFLPTPRIPATIQRRTSLRTTSTPLTHSLSSKTTTSSTERIEGREPGSPPPGSPTS